jgi:hypothetical protein
MGGNAQAVLKVKIVHVMKAYHNQEIVTLSLFPLTLAALYGCKSCSVCEHIKGLLS